MKPWQARWPLDAAAAQDRIAAAFPELRDLPVRFLSAGWDNHVFRCGPELLFRFPRRPVAVELLEAEAAALPRLAPSLPCAVPAPRYWCPRDLAGRPFAGVPWIAGQTACRSPVALRSTPGLATQLGAFLRALHGVAIDDDLARAVPEDRFGRTDLPRRLELTLADRPMLERLLGSGWPAVEHRLVAWADTEVPTTCAVVHGDLYARHVVVSATGQLAGVIDWGDCHRGSPALDLAVAWLVLPAATRARFFEAYGPVSAASLRVARFRALFHACRTLVYADDISDAALESASRWAIDGLCAEPVHGGVPGPT